MTDFQDMGKKLDERRNELVKELELANERKDQELARLAHLELEEIELKKRSLERLPDLERKLDDTVLELGRQLRIVSPSLMVRLATHSRPDAFRNWLAHRSDWATDETDLQRFIYLLMSSTFHIDHTLPQKQPSGAKETKESDSGHLDEDEGETGSKKKPDETG